jgi:hypothetical protein
VRAHEVLETHLRLIGALGNPHFKCYLGEVARDDRITQSLAEDGSHLSEFMLNTVVQAPTIWAKPDLVSEILSTAKEYRDNTPVQLEMLPEEPHGVVVLDKPLIYMDAMGRDEVIHVVTWGSLLIPNNDVDDTGIVRGWQAMLWNDAHRQPDGASREQRATWLRDGKLEYIEGGQGLFPVKGFFFAPTYTVIDKMRVPIPEDVRERHRADGYNPPRSFLNSGRLLLAVLDLVARQPEPGDAEQPAPETVTVDRPTTQRARTAGLEPHVRVAPYHRHRRPRREPDPNRVKRTRKPVEHKVHVPEHRRMQAYGPGRSLRKEIVIAAYDYGPEGPEGYVPPPTVYTVDGSAAAGHRRAR